MGNNNQSNSNGLKVLIGAAAGAALGYFMASDSGRKFRKEAKSKLNEVNDSLKENYEVASKNLVEKLEGVKTEANQLAESLKSKAEVFAKSASEKAEELKSKADNNIEILEEKYDESLDKARQKLNGIKDEL